MGRGKPANQRRVSVRANPDLINRLNALDPGLGSLYARDMRQAGLVMSQGFSAASGQRGTVTIAKQKRDSTGRVPPAVDVQGGQVVGGTWATDGDAFVTLNQMRSMFTCERFGGHVSGFPGWFEECVDPEQAAGGVGVMPYFFGWTVHIPPEADTFVMDPFTGPNMDLWSFVLPASASVARISYYLVEFLSTFSPGQLLNIGLYDVDFNLVLETGGIDIRSESDPTVTKDGAFTFELDQTYELEAGEYFLAISSAACIRMWGIATHTIAVTLLDHAEVQDQGLLTPGPYGLRMFEFNPTDPTPYENFPDTMDDSTGEFNSYYEDHIDVPMILFEGVAAHYETTND